MVESAIAPVRAKPRGGVVRGALFWAFRRIIGVYFRAIETAGDTPARDTGGRLFVANHVSWIDIVALHSQQMMGLVAKREIRSWPVVGWLASRAETIFHARGSTESMGGVLQEMLSRLRAGRSVGVFPEGGTRGGGEVGPFHARIFLAAVEAGAVIQPVALRYGEHGNAQRVVAFAHRERFVGNFLRLLGEPARLAEIHFLEPILPAQVEGRRRIAETARNRIVEAMES